LYPSAIASEWFALSHERLPESRACPMRVEQLEHVLRAASDLLGEPDFIVIGSAAILATYPDELLPVEATRSDEADVIPWNDPDGSKADRVDGAIGEGSLFHETHGYYAQGVDRGTARLPSGWDSRLVEIDAPGISPARGFCLEAHDLAISKIVAGRAKDYEFVGSLIQRDLLQQSLLLERLGQVDATRLPHLVLERAAAWIRSVPTDRTSR
jgi:hypothetical protein